MACLFPITIKNPAALIDRSQAATIPVPCRKCPNCLAKRANGWIFRLQQQDKIAEQSLFVTLTYSNDNITLTEKKFMTLVKSDFQKFMKRLRKNSIDGSNIKYFAVGEYGSDTYRPHYHAIIFNSNEVDIAKAWGLGHTHCDVVNGNTIAYTTKYMHKGRLIPMHSNDDRIPEFQLVSKGVGLNYISSGTKEFHVSDINRNYVIGDGGVKIPMPRIYRQKLFTEPQRKQQARYVQALISDQIDAKKAAYKAIHGSTDLFYHSEVQSKRAAVESFRNRQKQRNKL